MESRTELLNFIIHKNERKFFESFLDDAMLSTVAHVHTVVTKSTK